MPESNTISIKAVVLGPQYVGKTALLTRVKGDGFVESLEPTVGSNFFSYSVVKDGKTIKYELWDTAGQEQYHALNKMYFSNTGVAICVYDITSTESYEKMKTYLDEFLQDEGGNNPVVIIVGNKIDLEGSRRVPTGMVRDFAAETGKLFAEISVKNDVGVNELLEIMTDAVIKHLACIPTRGGDGHVILDEDSDSMEIGKKKKCC